MRDSLDPADRFAFVGAAGSLMAGRAAMLDRIRVVTLLAATLALSAAAEDVPAENLFGGETGPRTTVLLNRDWLYRPGEPMRDGAPDLDAGDGWRIVQLPHDASIGGPFTREGSDGANGWRPRGAGMYLKRFRLPPGAVGKQVMVEFQGVYRDSKVWINGHPVARQLNGYLGFEADLSPHVSFVEDNLLAVSYDNRTPGTSRWYTGEGIYRDVWLRMVDPLHVPLHGVQVATPQVTAQSATVQVETEIVHDRDGPVLCRLVTEILDPEGQQVATATAVAPVGTRVPYTFRQTIEVADPRRWDLDRPDLYTAVAKVYDGERLADATATRFGIRTLRMTPDQGLLLNDRKVVAKGGNLHHDLGCLGSAALKAGYARQIDELKAIGCNSFRLAHNPHAPVLLDVCDEKGILVFDEAYDKWTSQYYGGEVSFESQWPRDLAAFIRRDRNHPSVYIWSMGNEVLKQQGRHEKRFEAPDAAADYGAGLLRRMVALTHRLDPSRPATCGLFPAREKFIKEWEHWDDYAAFTNALPAEMAFHADVVSYNYTENMFAQDRKRFPQLMFIASETGTNLEFGNRRPSWLELDTGYVIGHYYWSGYDYLGESPWPRKSWGRSLIDLAGWVTPIGRYYQSFYDEHPMVHIMVRDTDPAILERFAAIDNKRWDWYPMVDHWTWPRRDTAALTTFSNCEEVELILNGTSLGVRRRADGPDGRIDWEIPYAPGELKAVGRIGGGAVAEHVLRTAGEPTRIRLTPHQDTLAADGLDLVYVDATLVDAEGRLAPATGTPIRFEVSGPAVNAGVASGNVISDEPWQADTRNTWQGRCRLVVRAGRSPGQVTVAAAADGLPGETIAIPCR